MKNIDVINHALKFGIDQADGTTRQLTLFDLYLLTGIEFRKLRQAINPNKNKFDYSDYIRLIDMVPNQLEFIRKNLDINLEYTFKYATTNKVWTTNAKYIPSEKEELIFKPEAKEDVKKFLRKNKLEVNEETYTSLLRHALLYDFSKAQEELQNVHNQITKIDKPLQLKKVK